MAAGVVADRRPDVLRHGVDSPKQVLNRLAAELGVLFDRRVGVGHIRRVVLAVMALRGRGVDVRLEGAEWIWKRGKIKRHLPERPSRICRLGNETSLRS